MSLMLCCWRQTRELDGLLVCLNRSEGFMLYVVVASLVFQLACLYLDDGSCWTKWCLSQFKAKKKPKHNF